MQGLQVESLIVMEELAGRQFSAASRIDCPEAQPSNAVILSAAWISRSEVHAKSKDPYAHTTAGFEMAPLNSSREKL
jgi:hypothetical protein